MIREMIIAGVLLMVFALVGSGLVAYTFDSTEARIAENERQFLLDQLGDVLPAGAYDNAIDQDTIQVTAPELGDDEPLTIYRARKQGEPVAAIVTAVAPDGYNGNIRLLVGVYTDGRIAGVRVVRHQETPGLGDAIERQKSDWINQFDGKSLDNPPMKQWAVKKDGGRFDQLTGATITPRAVVGAVKRALQYVRDHHSEIFKPETGG